MGLGATALTTNAKKEIPVPPGPPAPPFDPTSADNGLSVDSVSGRIVLGNDFFDPASPARLLSDREIVMDNGAGTDCVLYLNSPNNGIITALYGYSLEIVGIANNTTPSIQVGGGFGANAEITVSTGNSSAADVNITAISGTASLGMACGNDSLELLLDGSGSIVLGVSNFGIPITVVSFDTANNTMQLGATQVALNGATVQIAGTLNRRYLRSSKGAGVYNVDRDTDSDLAFINSGAAVFNLPNMAGSDDRPGFIFRLTVNNAAGVTAQAFAGQTIRFGTLASSSGGTVASVTVGSSVTLMWVGSVWVAECFTGVWSFT